MKLAIGFRGLLLGTRAETDAQGFVGERFKLAPVNAEALVALEEFSKIYGSRSLAIITRYKKPWEVAEIAEWLAGNQAVLRSVPRDHIHFCATGEARVETAAEIGVTHYLDNCPKLLGRLPNTMTKLLFGMRRVSEVTDPSIMVVPCWREFVDNFPGDDD